MGWLKKILEENHAVVDSWPEWKTVRWGMDKLEHDLENFTRIVHLYEEIDKLKQALAEKDQAYNTLMEQAVWAMRKYYDCLRDWNDSESEADRARIEAFLKERESHG